MSPSAIGETGRISVECVSLQNEKTDIYTRTQKDADALRDLTERGMASAQGGTIIFVREENESEETYLVDAQPVDIVTVIVKNIHSIESF